MPSNIEKLIQEHTLTAGITPRQIYTLGVWDDDGALWRLLEFLSKSSLEGHSVSFTIDDQSFGFDGDGADKIITLDKKVVD